MRATDNMTLRSELEAIPDLGALVARAAARWPDAACLRFDETGETLTFADIEVRTAAIARWLVDQGIAPRERVAVMVRNRPAFPLLWLGIARAGAAIVPLNVNYRQADARHVLDHSEARLVLAEEEFVPLLQDVLGDLQADSEGQAGRDIGKRGGPARLTAVGSGHVADMAALDAEATLPDLADTTLANIQYTSGTTGFPKGCMLSHGYWLAMGRRILFDVAPYLGPGEGLLTAQPFFYIDPQWNLMVALESGAELVILDGFHPSTMWQKIRAYGTSFFYCLGSMPTLLLKMPPDPADRDHKVRKVMCSAIPTTLHRALEDRWGVPWCEAFGMTETGGDLCVPESEHGELVGSGCLGRPFHDREAEVFGPGEQPLPPGVTGELVLRGAWFMDGYFKNQPATDEGFRGGWWHTGDLARKDEAGRFYYVGRLKDMIRRAGENIAAVEVEQVLEKHDAVMSAACVPVPDEIRGEEIKAYVVPAAGAEFEPAALAAWCADRLARFKVPRYWAAVDALPRTPSERVAKQKLIGSAADLRVGAWDRAEDTWR